MGKVYTGRTHDVTVPCINTNEIFVREPDEDRAANSTTASFHAWVLRPLPSALMSAEGPVAPPHDINKEDVREETEGRRLLLNSWTEHKFVTEIDIDNIIVIDIG